MRLQDITVSFNYGIEPVVKFTIAPECGEMHPSGTFKLPQHLMENLKTAASAIASAVNNTR